MRSIGSTLLRSSKPALASLLVVLLACLSLLAASGEWHRAFHHSEGDDGSPCLVCLLSKGQVQLPESVPLLVASVSALPRALPVAENSAFSDFTYCVSQSRAPPVTAFPHAVVA